MPAGVLTQEDVFRAAVCHEQSTSASLALLGVSNTPEQGGLASCFPNHCYKVPSRHKEKMLILSHSFKRVLLWEGLVEELHLWLRECIRSDSLREQNSETKRSIRISNRMWWPVYPMMAALGLKNHRFSSCSAPETGSLLSHHAWLDRRSSGLCC